MKLDPTNQQRDSNDEDLSCRDVCRKKHHFFVDLFVKTIPKGPKKWVGNAWKWWFCQSASPFHFKSECNQYMFIFLSGMAKHHPKNEPWKWMNLSILWCLRGNCTPENKHRYQKWWYLLSNMAILGSYVRFQGCIPCKSCTRAGISLSLRKALRRDYYALLGIARSATTREIRSGYQWVRYSEDTGRFAASLNNPLDLHEISDGGIRQCNLMVILNNVDELCLKVQFLGWYYKPLGCWLTWLTCSQNTTCWRLSVFFLTTLQMMSPKKVEWHMDATGFFPESPSVSRNHVCSW